MPLATWKDLVIDAGDPDLVSRFWARALGLRADDGTTPGSLRGRTPRHRVWINPVERPRIAKNRLHLDIDTSSIADLEALGATVLAPAEETGFGWTVMAAPDGAEFCAFVREPDRLPDYRAHGIGIDCADPRSLAAWWGAAFGTEVVEEHPDVHTLVGVAVDERMTLDFAAVPESKRGQNWVHWDVVGEARAFLDRGATHLWDTDHWTVLADPEGNEFCVFAPDPS